MVWGALGAAAISAGANIWSAFKSASSQKAANQANWYAQLQNQQWQERMSNTAHQREVADLRAAGLNPILSATGGSGASVGSVGNAQMHAADYSGVGEGVNSGVQNYLQTRSLMKSLDKTDADIKNETKTANATVATQKEQQKLLQAQQVGQGLSNIVNSATLGAKIDSVLEDLDASIAEAKTRKDRARIDNTHFNKVLYEISQILGPIGQLTGLGVNVSRAHSAHQMMKNDRARTMRLIDF